VVAGQAQGGPTDFYFHPDCTGATPLLAPASPADFTDPVFGGINYYMHQQFGMQEYRAFDKSISDSAQSAGKGLPVTGTVSDSPAWDNWLMQAMGWRYWNIQWTDANGQKHGPGGQQPGANGLFHDGQVWVNNLAIGGGLQGVGDSTGVAAAGCTVGTSGDLYGWYRPGTSLSSKWHGSNWVTCAFGAGTAQGGLGLGFTISADYSVNVKGAPSV
jgi:hypothetical protein